MNRKIIAIFYIILTLGGNQAKEDSTKQIKCQEYKKSSIFGCIRKQLTFAFAYQSMTTFASFIFFKISIWLAGFSAIGPVAGSIAAWMQSLIGNVVAGSLFSFLQAVAMGNTLLLLIPSLAFGTIIGIIYLVFNCFRSEYCVKEQQFEISDKKKEPEQMKQKRSGNNQKVQIAIIEKKQEESFWSSSLNIMKSGISATYSTIQNKISEISNSLPSMPKMPKEVTIFTKKLLQYSSYYIPDSISKFADDFLDFSSQVANTIKEQLNENTINLEYAFTYLTSTFGDYVNGINDLFEFVWLHKELIKEAFEYAIEVLQEQYNQFQNFKNLVENMRLSKIENACMNNFIEYLANV